MHKITIFLVIVIFGLTVSNAFADRSANSTERKGNDETVDTAIAGVTAGTIPFVSDTTPPSAENSINYSRSDHKFRFRYPGGDVYVSAAMTLETAADTTPDAFSFTDETDVAADGGQSCGAAITVGGTNYPTTISATGDTGFGYKINGYNLGWRGDNWTGTQY